MRFLLEVVREIRSAVDKKFVVAVKLNASDQLEGGFTEDDALAVVSALDATNIDLIEISGGTYFPGAKSTSDRAADGPYFLDFSQKAKKQTDKSIMVTGGFKTIDQAVNAISNGSADLVGLARALVLEPELPKHWLLGQQMNPVFPKFIAPPEGGVTAWYTMRLTDIGEDKTNDIPPNVQLALDLYNARDIDRIAIWKRRFSIN